MAAITIKRGDTFIYIATFEGLMLSELRSQIRSKLGVHISDVVISETSLPGTFIFVVADTKEWPVGVLYTDIETSPRGVNKSTETLEINVIRDVTK